jgi:hypothetical protein
MTFSPHLRWVQIVSLKLVVEVLALLYASLLLKLTEGALRLIAMVNVEPNYSSHYPLEITNNNNNENLIEKW